MDCDAKNEAENFQWCRDRVELNEDTTLQGDLQMSDGRFEYLLGTFDSDSWSFIRSTFVEKYGPPTSVDTEPVQNGMGAKFMNEELLWMRPEGALILKKYFSDLTKGVYMMRSTARIQREEARSNEEKRKATKKF